MYRSITLYLLSLICDVGEANTSSQVPPVNICDLSLSHLGEPQLTAYLAGEYVSTESTLLDSGIKVDNASKSGRERRNGVTGVSQSDGTALG